VNTLTRTAYKQTMNMALASLGIL